MTARIVQLIVLALLLAATRLLPGAGTPLGAAAVWAVCLAALVRSRRNGALSLPSLYLIVLGVFHLGVIVPDALGAHPTPPPDWFDSPYLARAIGLCSTAAAAFTLGACSWSAPREEEPSPRAGPLQLFWAGVLVAAAGATLLWIGVIQLGLLQASYGGYFELALRQDVRFFGFGLMLFPIGLLTAAVAATPRQMFALGALLAATVGPLFLHGFRGPVMVQATALVAVWAHKDLRTARRIAVVGAVAAFLVLPLIRAARVTDEEERQQTTEAVQELGPLAALFEMGESLRPLVLTVERVDSRAERLWMGRSYAMALERIAPNVSRWEAPDDSELTPSAWATKYGDLWAFEHGGGVGFSGVAEPYLNFGILGVMGFFLLLGLLVRVWEDGLGREPFRAAIGAAAFGSILWTVRNDAMELFRVLAVASATALVAWFAHRFLAARRHASVPVELGAPEDAA